MSVSNSSRPHRPGIGRTALLVFLFFVAFYALFADMEMDGYEVEPYLTAESLWLGHGVTLSTASEIGAKYHARFLGPAARADPLTQRHIVGERVITRTGFAQPVLEVPFYGLGLALDRALFDGGRAPGTPARYVFGTRAHEGFRIWWLSMLTAAHFPGAVGQPPPEVAAIGAKVGRLFAVLDAALLIIFGFALWRRRSDEEETVAEPRSQQRLATDADQQFAVVE